MDNQMELYQEATETPDENTPDTAAMSREERLRFAVADRKAGLSLRVAASKFDVSYKIVERLGKNPEFPISRSLQVMTREEEKRLADWVDGSAARGYPRARADIMIEAHEMLKIRNGENVGKPSYKWLHGFTRRHKLNFRKAACVTKAAANVREADIKAYFNRIEEALKKESCDVLLMMPDRILNADESFFHLNPTTGAVCFKSGTQHTQRVVKDEKAGITMMLTVRADGKKLKPFFVYPQIRISKSIDSSFPHGRATRTGTESGWMNGEAFSEFLRHIATELVEDGIDLPKEKVFLFVDNHGSHLKLECCEVARELGIIMVSLYPNTTHMTQPCDVSCIRSLKSAWRAKSADLAVDEFTVFDLTDDSSSNIVNEKNLLELLSGVLPPDLFHQIAIELARQKLVSIYSPEQDSTLCASPAAVPEAHATSSPPTRQLLTLPPSPRREGRVLS